MTLKKFINILKFLIATRIRIISLILIFLFQCSSFFILAHFKNHILNKTEITSTFILKYVFLLYGIEFNTIIIEFLIKMYCFFLKNDIYKELLRIHTKSHNKKTAYAFFEEALAIKKVIFYILNFVSQIIKITQIVYTVNFSIYFLYYVIMYIIMGFLGIYYRKYYDKKRFQTSVKQIEHIQQAYSLKNTITIHNAKQFIINRYMDIDEWEHVYFIINEIVQTLQCGIVMLFQLHEILTKNMVFNLTFNSEIESFNIELSDFFVAYYRISNEFNEQISEIKILDWDKQISILHSEIYNFDRSIAYNFNWNKTNFQTSGLMKNHFYTKMFYNTFAELLGLEKIEDILKLHVERLSYGQKKIVAIFRTLTVSAKIYILYNPFKGIDEKFHPQLQKIFENYNIIIINEP